MHAYWIYKVWILFFSLFISFYSFTSLFAFSISELSLEEKVGQILMVHFHGQEANEEARQLIQEAYVGGVIYYNWANELKDPLQVQNLSQGLRNLSKYTPHELPLLIAVDQEGGRVNRLKQGFTIFPGNYALGRTEKFDWGKESARMMGQELKAVGINLNLAPVVDICTDLHCSVIGMRSFSSDPKKTALWGKSVIEGYKQSGIISALKHFPGHGDVSIDSHESLPIIDKKKEILEQIELFPFRSLASQAEVIMTGHLFVPSLDREHCATFSKKIVQEFLREKLDFHGIIMSDSLAMEGALSQCRSLEESVLKCLQAGHDLILLGGKQLLTSQNGYEFTLNDIKRVHRFLVEAIKQGRLSEKRLDEAVARLLDLKKRYGLFDRVPLEPSLIKSHVYTTDHRTLARQIASRAMHLVQGKEILPLSLQKGPILILAPDSLRDDLSQTSWNALGPHVKILYFQGLNPDRKAKEEFQGAIAKAELTFYFSNNAWQLEGQRDLFKDLADHSSLSVAIVVGNPLDAALFKGADVVLCTYSSAVCSLQAAYDYLAQKRE